VALTLGSTESPAQVGTQHRSDAEVAERMQVHDVAVDGWLPLTAAAGRLGVSVDTVRRRIKSGEIEGRQVRRPQGFRWQVRLGAKGHAAPRTPGADVDAGPMQRTDVSSRQAMDVHAAPMQQLNLDPLAQLVRDLKTELVQKAEAAAMWQARAELIAAELSQARETIKALQAPATTPTAPAPAPIMPATAEAEPPASRPWWRFW
jgi:hypothetical protein